jgi:hypothetical protein
VAPPVSARREYLPHDNAIVVANTATKFFYATPINLFNIIPRTSEMQRYSKVSWRSKTGISSIACYGVLKKLPQTIAGAGFRPWPPFPAECSTTRTCLFFSQTKKAKYHGA